MHGQQKKKLYMSN